MPERRKRSRRTKALMAAALAAVGFAVLSIGLRLRTAEKSFEDSGEPAPSNPSSPPLETEPQGDTRPISTIIVAPAGKEPRARRPIEPAENSAREASRREQNPTRPQLTSPLPARTLKFPGTRSLGLISIRDQGAAPQDRRTPLDGWTSLAEARGKVFVPAGKEVRLTVKDVIEDTSRSRYARAVIESRRWWGGVTTRVRGGGPPKVSLAPLSKLGGDDVQSLDIQYRPTFLIPDEELVHLQGLSGLRELFLRTPSLGDPALAHVAGLSELRRLSISGRNFTDEGLKHLAGLTSLETLNLSRTAITDAGMKHLTGLTSLQMLDVSYTRITWAGLKQLAPLKSFESIQSDTVLHPRLTELDRFEGLPALRKIVSPGLSANVVIAPGPGPRVREIDIYRATGPVYGLEEIGSLGGLESLKIGSGGFGDEDLAHLSRLRTLRTLHLRGGEFTGADLARFADLIALEDLVIEIRLEADELSHLSRLASLQKLRLVLRGSEVDAEALAPLSALPSLKSLTIYCAHFATGAVASIGALSSLQSLRLAGSNLTDADLLDLAPFTRLRRLDLVNNLIAGEGIEHLTHLDSLEILFLSYNPLTDAALPHLKQMSNLKQLYLGGSAMSPEAVDELTRALPECKIVF